MRTTIDHDGDTWRVLSTGTARGTKTYCHLASTTRFSEGRNGTHPVQIADWIDNEKLWSPHTPDAFDMQVEDNMRDACGL